MKKQLLKLMTVGLLTYAGMPAKAQTVSTMENLTLATASYWNGSTQTPGTTFTSGNAIFPNYYDTSYGGFWSGGWAYSNMQDSTTAGYTNQYSARPAKGYSNSSNYAIGKQNAKIKLAGSATGKVVSGFYVTNSTYAYYAMKDGDSFARKFGDTTGTGSGLAQGSFPDWFKITVRKFLGGALANDSVDFYLADYRSSNSSEDYIVKDWQWVDLSSLENVDSLQFTLSSSDVGTYGMNTPAYFCMDNFTTADSPTSIQNINSGNYAASVYPNPAVNIVTIDLSKLTEQSVQVNVTDITGKFVAAQKINSADILLLDVSNYKSGIYFINMTGKTAFINTKLIKE